MSTLPSQHSRSCQSVSDINLILFFLTSTLFSFLGLNNSICFLLIYLPTLSPSAAMKDWTWRTLVYYLPYIIWSYTLCAFPSGEKFKCTYKYCDVEHCSLDYNIFWYRKFYCSNFIITIHLMKNLLPNCQFKTLSTFRVT